LATQQRGLASRRGARLRRVRSEQQHQHRPRLASRTERRIEWTRPVELVSDVNANQWFVLTAERIPGKSYRWYVNGKLYKQVLAPGLTPKPEEAGVTKVLASPYTVPLDYLRWPIQFESKGTSQTNDVIVAIDHWSCWEPV
jgi:hypothetical protein